LKILYLVRHGKAVSRELDIPDFDRYLIEEGKHGAREVAKRLRKQGVLVSLIISSPAARAIATARIFARELGYKSHNIRTRKTIYDQKTDSIFSVLHEIPNDIESVMIVGHEPSLSELAHTYIKGFTKNLPTSGVVGARFKADSWKKLTHKKGKCILFDSPKKIDT
jgi:phosphohistidine phosphatase